MGAGHGAVVGCLFLAAPVAAGLKFRIRPWGSHSALVRNPCEPYGKRNVPLCLRPGRTPVGCGRVVRDN